MLFLQSYQEMLLFASPDLVPLPGEKKKKVNLELYQI